jgi:hypothetical protein
LRSVDAGAQRRTYGNSLHEKLFTHFIFGSLHKFGKPDFAQSVDWIGDRYVIGTVLKSLPRQKAKFGGRSSKNTPACAEENKNWSLPPDLLLDSNRPNNTTASTGTQGQWPL